MPRASFRPTSSPARNLEHAFRNDRIARGTPEGFRLALSPAAGDTAADALPRHVTLLRPDPSDPARDQLFVDHMPLPRAAWQFDPDLRHLSWQGPGGGGHLMLAAAGHGGLGNVGSDSGPVSVIAAPTTTFVCDVAADCGATYLSVGGNVEGFQWDPESPAWRNAHWVQNRLTFSYSTATGSPFDPPSFSFRFQDDATGAAPWSPPVDAFGASLVMGSRKNAFVWNLVFRTSVDPARDASDPQHPPQGPDSVFPYWLHFVEDAAAFGMDGVMMVDDLAPKGRLVGVRGTRQDVLATGYYRTGAGAAPVGLFDGNLHVDGAPAADCRLTGRTLTWSDLAPDAQQRTGLPQSGSITFDADGACALDTSGTVRLQRLDNDAAIAALADHADFHPAVVAGIDGHAAALAAAPLQISTLLAMNPFGEDESGQMRDQVEKAVTDGLGKIMNSFIPRTMWSLLFSDAPQPDLGGDPELVAVANSPVPGVDKPIDWYGSLATAVLTSGMADGSNANCRNMNGPRAQAWLRTQVAASKVYLTHSQHLFHHHWIQRFPLTQSFLDDQAHTADAHAPLIDQHLAQQVAEITAQVVNPPDNPHLQAQLISEVQAVAAYAKTNRLFWAFEFVRWNTSPALLGNIAMQMSVNTGAVDSQALSRLFQQNISVLTALDPSGFFAKRYTSIVNTFIATNILPSMYGFTGDVENFDMIREYLRKFVEVGLASEDQKIAAAARDIGAILARDDLDQILTDSIAALRSISSAIQDALALPFIATRFSQWFTERWPRLSSAFATVLIGGITGLAIFNVLRAYKHWDQLTDAERSQIVLDTVQLSVQILAAVVQRGVRIYALFGVNGLSAAARRAGLAKIIVSGENPVAPGMYDALDDGITRIANNTARWLADTEGTFQVTQLANGLKIQGNGDLTLTQKIFGRNLDEFIAGRIGVLFVLAGIGFSLYAIIEGDNGLALAADIVNIVSGALMVFSTVGGAILGEGAVGIAATAVSIAGPFAVVLAFIGFGLMLWQMFGSHPPDPVQEFVDQYVRPAQLAVAAKATAIDYATAYISPDQKDPQNGKAVTMVGFTLGAQGHFIRVAPDGTVSLGDASRAPDGVFQTSTDGFGLAKIGTVVQANANTPPVTVFLSLLSDGRIAFRAPGLGVPPDAAPGTPGTVTQTWLVAPVGLARLTSSGDFLAALDLTLQPVPPDNNGQYAPAQASGFVTVSGSTLGYVKTGAGTTFTLTMSGLAPAFMTMPDLHFVANSTPADQQFGPAFAVNPSAPVTFSLTPPPPAFLEFDASTGRLNTTGQQAVPVSSGKFTLQAANLFNKLQVVFSISIDAPAPGGQSS